MVAGQIPQATDRPRRHETGPQHLSLGHLAQPHSVQHIGFRSTGQMFDIAGVDQPRVQPVRLQQVEHRLPVRRRRLHHHPLDAHLDQPIGQLSERPRHRRVRCDFLRPPFTAAGAGTRTQHTNSALPMSRAATLAMICSSSCDSANIAVISSFQLTPVHSGVWSPADIATGETNLILVLETAATVKGPNATSDARLDTRPRRTTG